MKDGEIRTFYNFFIWNVTKGFKKVVDPPVVSRSFVLCTVSRTFQDEGTGEGWV